MSENKKTQLNEEVQLNEETQLKEEVQLNEETQLVIKKEELEENAVMLEISVPADKFEEVMQKSYFKNVKRFNIPGFRKGKAPRSIIVRHYGEGVFYEDAMNFAYEDTYWDAIQEAGLDPVSKPEIDIKEIGDGKPFIYTVKVTNKPEVELGKYKGVKADKIEAKVTDEEVDTEIDNVAERNARIITVEDREEIKENDITVIDYEGFVDGVAFEGGKGENYSLTIGSKTFIPGFEEQLIGSKKGAEQEVNVTFPEEYHSEELKGKEAVFKVKINEIKVKEKPVIDDEFAKDVSEFDTLDEYKNDIRNKLIKKAEDNAKKETENAIIKKVVDDAKIDVPNVMIENRIDRLLREFDMNMRYQGLSLEKYIEMTGMELDKMRDSFRERALNEVRAGLVIEKISEIESIEATEEDVAADIEELAGQYGQTAEDIRGRLKAEDMENVKNDTSYKKTIKFIIDNASMPQDKKVQTKKTKKEEN